MIKPMSHFPYVHRWIADGLQVCKPCDVQLVVGFLLPGPGLQVKAWRVCAQSRLSMCMYRMQQLREKAQARLPCAPKGKRQQVILS